MSKKVPVVNGHDPQAADELADLPLRATVAMAAIADALRRRSAICSPCRRY